MRCAICSPARSDGSLSRLTVCMTSIRMSRDSDAGPGNKDRVRLRAGLRQVVQKKTHRFLPALYFTGKGIIAGYRQRAVPFNVAVVPEGPYLGGRLWKLQARLKDRNWNCDWHSTLFAICDLVRPAPRFPALDDPAEKDESRIPPKSPTWSAKMDSTIIQCLGCV